VCSSDLTARVTRYVTVGQRVWHLAIDAAGKRAFAANGVSNTVSVIDIARRDVIATIPVGQAPWGVVVAE
jgi:YVTN family beta-propeller protein